MATVEIIKFPVDGDVFQAILSEHGDGEIQPRFNYSECTEEAYPDHKVIRGVRQDNSLTGTGFLHLQMDPGETPSPANVIAGVDQLP